MEINKQISETEKELEKIEEIRIFYLYCENKLLGKEFLTEEENLRFRKLKNYIEGSHARIEFASAKEKLSLLKQHKQQLETLQRNLIEKTKKHDFVRASESGEEYHPDCGHSFSKIINEEFKKILGEDK